MQAFHIRYRNTQGTLMRILNAASRRGLEITSVRTENTGETFHLVLPLDVNAKQVGQLYREWYAIADVIHVGSASPQADEWSPAHPPAGVTIEDRPAARA